MNYGLPSEERLLDSSIIDGGVLMDCWQTICQEIMDVGKVDSVWICAVEETEEGEEVFDIPIIQRGDGVDYAVGVLHDMSLNSFIVGVENQRGGYGYEEENMLVLHVRNAESEDHQTNITIDVIEAVLGSVGCGFSGGSKGQGNTTNQCD